MDVRFLRTTVEAYITKHGLQEHLNADDLYTDLYSLVVELRENDIELYHKLYDTGLMQKTRIIEAYLENEYGSDEVINELMTAVIVGGATALFTLLYRDRITKKVLEIGKSIGDTFDKAGKYVTKLGRYWSFRYAIIHQNVNKCYRACGVNEKDITMWHYMATKSGTTVGTKNSISQGNCLSICYIDYTIETISLLSKSYFICLKKTGDFGQVQSASPDALLNMLSGLQLSAACKNYYSEMKETFDKFYTLLDYIHGKNEGKKNKELAKLRSKLIESRKFIAKTNNFKQFK